MWFNPNLLRVLRKQKLTRMNVYTRSVYEYMRYPSTTLAITVSSTACLTMALVLPYRTVTYHRQLLHYILIPSIYQGRLPPYRTVTVAGVYCTVCFRVTTAICKYQRSVVFCPGSFTVITVIFSTVIHYVPFGHYPRNDTIGFCSEQVVLNAPLDALLQP